jgi:hypothetical protein
MAPKILLLPSPTGTLHSVPITSVHTGSYGTDKSSSNLCQRFLFPDIMVNFPILVEGLFVRGEFQKVCLFGNEPG